MEMPESNHAHRGHDRKWIYAVMLFLGLGVNVPLPASDRYQHEMLLNPSAEMLAAESRGYIMIYDGLENRVVERALTEQFDRIENMMFVGTRYVQQDGSLDTDDDCDD